MTREEAIELLNQYNLYSPTKQIEEAIDMAIEALSQPIVAKHFDIQSGYIYCSPEIAENVKVVVRCKDCRHANECHKSVQYTRNEPRTVTIGYSPIEWCSHGERKDKTKFPATYNTNTKCGGCIHLDELGRCLNFMLAKDDRSCWRGSWENNNGELAEQTERREE